jgi:hypothetical protein
LAVVAVNESEEPTGGFGSVVPELTGLLLSEATVAGLLDVIVNVAASAVDGVDGASVSLLIADGARFVPGVSMAYRDVQCQLGADPRRR